MSDHLDILRRLLEDAETDEARCKDMRWYDLEEKCRKEAEALRWAIEELG